MGISSKNGHQNPMVARWSYKQIIMATYLFMQTRGANLEKKIKELKRKDDKDNVGYLLSNFWSANP